MITYRKIAAIDGNDTGYNVFDDGNLVGQVYGYTGQSATHEYHQWTGYLNGQPLPTRKTRWEAVELMQERKQ